MIDKLIERIKELNNPTVVGLDPREEIIPEFIRKESYRKYGRTLKGLANAYFKFNKMIIDEIYDLVPAVKPQISMYEELGPDGIDCFIKTIKYAKEKNLIVISDIKRGDIASTAKSYSRGHIGRVSVGGNEHKVFDADFVTINGYMGYDAISPYIENCKELDKGMFVLVKTSNPNSGDIQDLKTEDGRYVYEHMGELVSKWGEELIGKYGFSKIGAVVGATYKEQGKILRDQNPNTFFLVPGYGAQGATAEDLKGCFNEDGLGALINSSRGIIAAYKKDEYKDRYSEEEFHKAAREAVIRMRQDLLRVI